MKIEDGKKVFWGTLRDMLFKHWLLETILQIFLMVAYIYNIFEAKTVIIVLIIQFQIIVINIALAEAKKKLNQYLAESIVREILGDKKNEK